MFGYTINNGVAWVLGIVSGLLLLTGVIILEKCGTSVLTHWLLATGVGLLFGVLVMFFTSRYHKLD